VPHTIVLAFMTLDGIIEDPDGSGRTPYGGWAFRGPVAPDPFRLGPKLDTGVLLLGRKTWELLSLAGQGLTDDFSRAMNRMPKLVASRTRTADLSAWGNSSLMSGELLDTVERNQADRDVIVMGSASVVHALAEHDRVDEYRILIFPTAVGDGTPLFSHKTTPAQLRLLSAEASGPAILARYGRFDG
jgi:dihydrofolate reductase